MTISTTGIVAAAYIVAALLFVLSLAGLSRHETAKNGNAYGMAGMAIALVATIWVAFENRGWPLGAQIALIGVPMLVGGAIGVWRALRVEMTGMPQLIAMLHSFVGLAAVLVGYNTWLIAEDTAAAGSGHDAVHLTEIFLGVFIGAVTLTGSVVAFLKLSARIPSSPLMLPGRHLMNLVALLVIAGLLVWFVLTGGAVPLLLMTVIALVFGWHLVASIGGGDMPVVVSMLNSYSGWAAAAAGFMLGNDLLIVTGALVGSSGAIPQLHHVPGHEPLLRLASSRAGSGPAPLPPATTPTTASTARPPPSTSPTCSRTPSPWSSRPATGWRSPRRSTPSPTSPTSCASGAWRSGSGSTRSPAGSRAT